MTYLETFEYNPEAETYETGWGAETEWGGEVELEEEAASSAQLSALVKKHRNDYARLMKAVAAMRRHIAVRNGRPDFTLPARSTHDAAARLGIDHSLFSHLYRSLKMKKPLASQVTASRELEWESELSCAGVTNLETTWWGVKLWLDECKTQTLVDALKGGGVGAGAICAIIGLAGTAGAASPICAVIAALGQALGFAVAAVDDSGGKSGVVLTWTWAQLLPGVPVIPIVTSQ
jgi:hypothetical protein